MVAGANNKNRRRNSWEDEQSDKQPEGYPGQRGEGRSRTDFIGRFVIGMFHSVLFRSASRGALVLRLRSGSVSFEARPATFAAGRMIP
jgi:hypothetical protein